MNESQIISKMAYFHLFGKYLCLTNGLLNIDFFRRIQKSFPLLEELTVVNRQARNEKSENVNDDYLPLIHYKHLSSLDLLLWFMMIISKNYFWAQKHLYHSILMLMLLMNLYKELQMIFEESKQE